MEGIKHDVILRLVKVLDAVLITFPFALVWLFYYAERTWAPFYQKGNWAVIGLLLFLYAMFGKVYDAFCISMNQMFESVYSQSLAALFSDSVMYIVSWLLTKHLPNPVPLFFVFFCQVILAAVWFKLANRWYYSVFAPKKSAVIYDMRSGLERLVEEYGLAKKFDICLTEEAEECLKGIHMLDGMDAVFLSGIHSHDRNIILKYCVEKGIEVYVIPRIGDTIMSGAKQLHMFHLPILRTGRYSPSPMYLALKRLADIIVASIALIVLFPAWLITAIAVKVEDGGDIFYRQCRLTKDGKRFDVLKFRSMKMDAEGDGVARLSSGENDERLTKVGRVIRKVRLDELPQLLCILKGDMSIVGPRPERPEIARQYEEEMPEFRLRLQAKAGLTGYAQVYGKYNTTPYDKLQMDLMYIAHPSMVEDFRIMLATVKILFMSESTEGVGEEAVTEVEAAIMKQEKLKVLQVNKLYYPVTGGIERVVQQIAEGLNDKTDMKVLVCRRKGKTVTEQVNGVWVRRSASLGVLASLPISFSFLWQLRTLSKDRDIIQFHMPFPLGDLACLLSGYQGIVIAWWHSDIVRQKKMMKLYSPLMEAFLKRADVIIVATKGHIDGSAYLKPYRDKCVIIPFGVEKELFLESTKWLEDRKAEERENNKTQFLFVGRFVYYKGCRVLLEAFKDVKNAKLVMVGNGPMQEELEQLVKKYGLEGKVEFPGNVSEADLREQYKLCDVFVLPSIVRSEAFGLVQIEAMSYGKPVINTNLPSGVPYVSPHMETGLTVEPGNVKELTEAMNWMVEHREERLDMGKRARMRVQQEYTVEKMLERVQTLYKEQRK